MGVYDITGTQEPTRELASEFQRQKSFPSDSTKVERRGRKPKSQLFIMTIASAFHQDYTPTPDSFKGTI